MQCSVITEECIGRAWVLTVGAVGCRSTLKAGAMGGGEGKSGDRWVWRQR